MMITSKQSRCAIKQTPYLKMQTTLEGHLQRAWLEAKGKTFG